MMYKIEYDNGKCCNYAHSRADLLEWLRILRDEKIDDILQISKEGNMTSVIEKYKKFLYVIYCHFAYLDNFTM